MSTWTLYVAESGDEWPSGGTSTIPRPQEDLDVGLNTTQQAIQLADGSLGYYTPETKTVKPDLQFTWYMNDEDFKDELEGYIENHDFIKIVTHTGKEYIGRFLNLQSKWLVGESPDEYMITVGFTRMAGSA